ncbi:cellulase family glycosylhydrolase [Mycoplasmatota bacterium WC30]
MQKIRGVNLGGWLVLEKWMTPELYQEYEAKDEYNLLLQMGESRCSMLKKHRDNFVQKSDFKWIHDYGLNTVRLPVGHWLFEDKYPYINTLEYVKMAFMWAESYNIKVLLDVHAAPGCQNGFDNGGLSGICEWTKGDNIRNTLEFIERLTIEFQFEKSLLGIEILNEPRWDLDINVVQNFYVDAYQIIRKYLNQDFVIVFHDAFRLTEWKSFFKNNYFENVILDTHMYQVFSHNDSIRNTAEVIDKVSLLRYKELKEIFFVDVIVGEWSLGIHQNTLKELVDNNAKDEFYKTIGKALLTTYGRIKGWFFWNYNLSEESTKKNIGWSFRDIVSRGYLPRKIEGE